MVGVQLFVGGEFSKVDNVPVANMARLSSSRWDSVGGGIEGHVFSLLGAGDCIYVCGSFTRAGLGYAQAVANNTARWCSDPANEREVVWEGIDWGRRGGEVGQCKVMVAA